METWAEANGTHWHSSHPWATLWGLGASIIRGAAFSRAVCIPLPPAASCHLCGPLCGVLVACGTMLGCCRVVWGVVGM